MLEIAEFTKMSSVLSDASLLFCNRKLMRTDIFFTWTTKPICHFVNTEIKILNRGSHKPELFTC